jgi:hypothetical protein
MKGRHVSTVRERRQSQIGEMARPVAFAVSRTPAIESAAAARGQNGPRRVILAEPVGAVDREQLREPRARTIDPAPDRPYWGLADRSRLLVGETRRADEKQGLALIENATMRHRVLCSRPACPKQLGCMRNDPTTRRIVLTSVWSRHADVEGISPAGPKNVCGSQMDPATFRYR